MKKILVYFLVIISQSCSIKNQSNLNKDNWKFSFKNQVFISSLKHLYGKDFDKILVEQDMSASNNFGNLNGQYYSALADSIAKDFSNNINNLPKGYLIEGKRTILNHCLEYYNSEKLNSIADSLYKNLKK